MRIGSLPSPKLCFVISAKPTGTIPGINALANPDYLNRLATTGSTFSDELGMSDVMAANPDLRWSMAKDLRESQLTLARTTGRWPAGLTGS